RRESRTVGELKKLLTDPTAVSQQYRPVRAQWTERISYRSSRSLPKHVLQLFIESKNSELVFVCLSLPSRNSMASVVPIGLRMRRSTNILVRSDLSTSSSSLRVPDLRISTAGNTRLSA